MTTNPFSSEASSNPRRGQPRTGEHMTVEEYFRLDDLFPFVKYEFQDGQVRLMAGGTGEHDMIAFNTRAAIDLNFRSGPCFVRGADMRVLVEKSGAYFYPDCTVSCDVSDRRRGNRLIRSPRIVVGVLSPSTENDDRGKKLKAYQSVPTIQEIVLIDQFAPHVEIYRRDEDDETVWRHLVFEPNEEVELASVDVRISFEEIYRGVKFDEPLLQDAQE
ncbi:MAG: Uma2 family endonuclease [Ktedonobacteraceae bacterium]|nr:Uma2 family endonuclease [Ktedonobacteraceae bacterium]